jgi:hypothetical protein
LNLLHSFAPATEKRVAYAAASVVVSQFTVK